MDKMWTARRILNLPCIFSLCIVLILAANSENNRNEVGERHRRASSITTSSACGPWSQWINRNTPSESSPNEYEHFTDEDLRQLYPSAGGIQVKRFQCRDEKLEPFQNVINRTVLSKSYIFTCNDMYATCNMTNTPGTLKTCPDFAIRIMCECSPSLQTQGVTIDGTESSTETRNGSEIATSIEGSGTGGTETGTGGGESGTATSAGVDTDNGSSGSGKGASGGGSETANGIKTSSTGTNDGYKASTAIGGSGTLTSGVSETEIGIGENKTEYSGGSKTASSTRNGSGTENENVLGTAGSGTENGLNGNSDNFCGNSVADGSLLVGGVSLPWWLVPQGFLLLMCIINLCVVLCVYRKLRSKIRNTVFPL